MDSWEIARIIVTGIMISLIPGMMLGFLIKQKWNEKKKSRQLKKENHSISEYLEDQ
ncbi:MAG TPA: hypothetical protein HA319_04220 [Nitrosopumilaceae archaeon]|nr:hypothetical protein [Nitrosopumilaceae archaeon]